MGQVVVSDYLTTSTTGFDEKRHPERSAAESRGLSATDSGQAPGKTRDFSARWRFPRRTRDRRSKWRQWRSLARTVFQGDTGAAGTPFRHV